MNSLWIWTLIIGMGLITYIERVAFVLLLRDREIPPTFERALRFVPPAVLSALVLPAFVYREGVVDISLGNLRLVAGLLAAVVAWRTRNILVTIGVGMGALWLLTWLN